MPKGTQIADRIRIVESIGNLFFPDEMPGFPDYPAANDNLITGQAVYHARRLFEEIRHLSPMIAMKMIEIVHRESDETLRMICEINGIDIDCPGTKL